jgi:hypothetical protein
MEALEAFQLAFPLPHLPATFRRECNVHPLSDQVVLLIKTFPPPGSVLSGTGRRQCSYGCALLNTGVLSS